jgi:hypothetical protein
MAEGEDGFAVVQVEEADEAFRIADAGFGGDGGHFHIRFFEQSLGAFERMITVYPRTGAVDHASDTLCHK